MTGGACLAAAALIPGTIAHDMAAGLRELGPEPEDREVGIGNPAGVLGAVIHGARNGEDVSIKSAAYMRSAQILIRGHTPIYHASSELIAHYREGGKCAARHDPEADNPMLH